MAEAAQQVTAVGLTWEYQEMVQRSQQGDITKSCRAGLKPRGRKTLSHAQAQNPELPQDGPGWQGGRRVQQPSLCWGLLPSAPFSPHHTEGASAPMSCSASQTHPRPPGVLHRVLEKSASQKALLRPLLSPVPMWPQLFLPHGLYKGRVSVLVTWCWLPSESAIREGTGGTVLCTTWPWV